MKKLKIPKFKKYTPTWGTSEHIEVKENDIQRIFNFLNIQIPYSIESSSNCGGYGWNGKMFYFGGLNFAGVVHEICHWMISPSTRKKYPDFGLGRGFNSESNSKLKVKKEYAYDEEYIVCLLEYTILQNMRKIQEMQNAMKDAGFYESKECDEKYYKLLRNKNVKNFLIFKK